MGYYTNYSISIAHGSTDIIEDLRDMLEKDSAYHFVIEDDLIYTEDAVKWYAHGDDMKEISKHFPDVVILVEGDGEEDGDLWREYWKNGECEGMRAEITIKWAESKMLREAQFTEITEDELRETGTSSDRED